MNNMTKHHKRMRGFVLTARATGMSTLFEVEGAGGGWIGYGKGFQAFLGEISVPNHCRSLS